MPAQILHVLFGEDALSRAAASRSGLSGDFAARLSGGLRAASPAGVCFALGCQGPDLFYHNQRSRPVSIEYGTLLHRRGCGSFSAALLAEADTEPLRAYALGFLTHAVLDRAAHPYIVCKSGWVSPAKPETARYARCHAFFERVLDVLMLERLRRADAASWDQEALLCRLPAEETDALVRAVSRALRGAFPERAGRDEQLERRVANAFRDSVSFYRITNPVRTSLSARFPDDGEYLKRASGRASVSLIYPELFPYGLDYLNLARAPWPHPCRPDELDRRSFPEIYSDALDAAVPVVAFCLERFAAGSVADLSLAAELSGAVGDGGLSVVDAAGLPCAPRVADPLPLDAVLDRQYRLRLARIAARG